MDRSVSVWPKVGLEVWAELRQSPGRFALIAPVRSDSGADQALVASAMSLLRRTAPLSVGSALSVFKQPPTEVEVINALSNQPVLTDLDVLFQPELRINLLRLLQRLARRESGVIATWPGTLNGASARYSVPGRRDYYEGLLDNCLILHPRSTLFDDQAPFDIERLP